MFPGQAGGTAAWHENFFIPASMNSNGLSQQPIDSRHCLSFGHGGSNPQFYAGGKGIISVAIRREPCGEGAGGRTGTVPSSTGTGRKSRSRPAGEHLLHYAEKILAICRWRGFRWTIARAGGRAVCAGRKRKILRLFAAGILRSFLKEFPGWPVSVKTGDTRQCVEWLEQNVIDVAVVVAPSRPEPVN